MDTSAYQLFNTPPSNLVKLVDLALDLRWAWSHEGDRLWRTVDPVTWELTRNPWLIMQSVSPEQLQTLSVDREFLKELDSVYSSYEEYLGKQGWFRQKYPSDLKNPVAYFSMEFGIGEAIPLYAGGLGILAGDYLKTASDLNVPMIALGILYQEGYFRQTIDSNGWQVEMFPNSDPHTLPLTPSRDPSGAWLGVSLELPGRTLLLRVWQARLGKVTLYLMDSNVALNSPSDRGITARLYEANTENRLLQEMVLGIGGWKVLEALDIYPQICHFNEGHAAFLVIERARRFMYLHDKPFHIARWATRAGNVFTTHTPVAAAFDVFPPELVTRNFGNYLKSLQIAENELLALGRQDPANTAEPFNMAVLAVRGSISVNGVSKLHGRVSRRLFQPLYPRWPEHEVPITYITNGVHTPSWDSALSDALWTRARGEKSWLDTLEPLASAIQRIPDNDLWSFRSAQRQTLVANVRERLGSQLRLHGAGYQEVEKSQHILDPNALTMGFARRFTAYKRPNLLLHSRERLISILTNSKRPVQLIVAGKAHPQDIEGKRLIQDFLNFSRDPAVSSQVVFLEDYDIPMAENLVLGVDIWINTPRRPWEACGTSGMKVLVNGGLNFSEMDGWWAEAYSPEVGWAIGDSREHGNDPAWDAVEANQFYDILEHKIVPEFYTRDERGLPVQWISMIRSSMALLTPHFSTNRMLREYVEHIYLPVSRRFDRRLANNSALAESLYAWQMSLDRSWSQIHIDNTVVKKSANGIEFETAVYLGEIDPAFVEVQIYAMPSANSNTTSQRMKQIEKLPGAVNGYLYRGVVNSNRPSDDFSIRVIPCNSDVAIPLEDNHIFWQK
jgi:glycogen phosphorylase